MRCRTEPDGLRAQRDRSIVAIEGAMTERDMNAHDDPFDLVGGTRRQDGGAPAIQASNGRAKSRGAPLTPVA
jgi:hypothetical protein